MPFTLPINITIVLGAAPPEQTPGYGEILVAERPAQDGRAFTLAARAGDGTPWRADLSPAQSEALAARLDQLPATSLTAPTMSFDGMAYQVRVVRESTLVTFTWSNEDWRSAPGVSQADWKAVVALAEYVEALKKLSHHVPRLVEN